MKWAAAVSTFHSIQFCLSNDLYESCHDTCLIKQYLLRSLRCLTRLMFMSIHIVMYQWFDTTQTRPINPNCYSLLLLFKHDRIVCVCIYIYRIKVSITTVHVIALFYTHRDEGLSFTWSFQFDQNLGSHVYCEAYSYKKNKPSLQ